MVKKLFTIILCIAILFTLLPTVINASVTGQPKINGTFIQFDLIRSWSDAELQTEFQYLKDAGMHYIIIGPTAVNDPSGQYSMLTFYPTQIPGCAMKPGYEDLVDKVLRNAELKGIKVFMGTNGRSDYFDHMANDPQWFYDRMTECNLVSDELWANYKSLYPNAFYGWYWCNEIDNLNYNTNAKRDTVANGLNMVLDHLQSAGIKLPFMLSPFMNAACGTPSQYEDMWKYIFARAHFGAGDIFSPQDSVGGGGTNLSNVADWFAALKRAVDTEPGLALWSNSETFVGTDYMSATIGRICSQLQLEAPYVEDFVCFAYSHYQSPLNVNSGYHATYMDYINNGSVETVSPTAPASVTARPLPTGGIYLDWEAASDNIGICGYYVFRNGTNIAKIQMERKDWRTAVPGIATDYTDFSVNASTTYNYQVQAFDFAGNLSPMTTAVNVTAENTTILSNNVARGCSYTVNPGAHANYPDTNGTELTDGITASASDYSNSAWQGWLNDTREVVLDLGSTKKVQQFIASMLYDESVGVYLPSDMTVSVSTDGVSYTEAGKLAIPVKVTKNIYKLGLTLNNPVNARYIKLTSARGGHSWTEFCWTFIDEFEVRNADFTDLPNLISKNCTYTVNPGAHPNYPDTLNKELTDGKYSPNTTYTNSEWQGWLNGTRDVIINLGSQKQVQQVAGSFLYNLAAYMYTPDTATVWVSNDNVSYTQIGSLSGPIPPAGASKIKQYLTLDNPVNAQYVKVVASGGAWIFVDEIEVRNNFADRGSVISANKTYTENPGAHPNYPDTNNKELTDGLYSINTTYTNSQWQGWNACTQEVVLDLGSDRLVQQVSGNFLSNPSNFMYTPDTAAVLLSDNGSAYTQVGELDSDTPGTSACKCKQFVTLRAPVPARYIKLVATGGAWVFIDELEVRN